MLSCGSEHKGVQDIRSAQDFTPPRCCNDFESLTRLSFNTMCIIPDKDAAIHREVQSWKAILKAASPVAKRPGPQ